MTRVACESKLRLVIRSSINPCQGNWVAIGLTVVYYAQAAHTFSAGIKYRHCISTFPTDFNSSRADLNVSLADRKGSNDKLSGHAGYYPPSFGSTMPQLI